MCRKSRTAVTILVVASHLACLRALSGSAVISFWDSPGIEAIRDSVGKVESFSKPGEAGRQGTALIVTNDGLVVTPRHLFHHSSGAEVVLRSGKVLKVSGWVADDPSHDLVILRVVGASVREQVVAPFQVGKRDEKAFVFGRKSGEREGIILGAYSMVQGYRWIAAKVKVLPGDSGGPAYDEKGRLLGIVVAAMGDVEHALMVPAIDLKELIARADKAEPRPLSELKVRRLDELYGNGDFKAALQASVAGDRTEATARMRKAIEEFPRSAVCRLLLGSYLADIGRYPAAEDSYRIALELKPNYALAYAFLAGTLASQDKNKQGLEAAKKAIELEPDLPEGWMNVGTIYLKSKRFDEAWHVVDRLKALPDGESFAKTLAGVLGEVSIKPAE